MNKLVEDDISIDQVIDPKEMRLDNLIETLRGSGFMFGIWRKRVYDPDFSFISKIPADDFDIELLKQQHGGGRYMVRVTDQQGKIRNNFQFGIDDNFKGHSDQHQHAPEKGVDTIALAKTVAEIANGNKRDGGNDMMIGMMERQAQQSQQFLTLMLQMQSENTKSMMGMMTAIATNKPSGGDFGSAITPILIEMIKTSSMKSAGDNMDIERMIKIRDLLAPPAEEKPSFMDRMLDVAPSVLPLFLGRGAGGGMMMPPPPDMTSSPVAPPNAAVLPPQTQAVPSCPPTTGEAPIQNHQNPKPKLELVPLLKRGAELDSDPASYAVIVLDTVGADNIPQLIGFLKAGDEWKKLFAGFSEAEMAWVTEWRDEVIDAVEGEDGDDDCVDAVEPMSDAPPVKPIDPK